MPQLTDLARPEYWLNIGSPGLFHPFSEGGKALFFETLLHQRGNFPYVDWQKSLAILLSFMSDRTKQKIPATSEAPLSRVLYREEEGEMECPLSAQVPAESRPRKMP